MKLLHTSDWHLGKRLLNKDRFEEQQSVMKEITIIAEKENVDIIIIAGDLFDTYSPSNAAQRLLYETLQNLSHFGKRPVIAIAGNHDSPERIESPESLADVSGIFLLGHPQSQIDTFNTNTGIQITASEPGFMEIKLPKFLYPIRLLHTPFANEERLRIYLENEKSEIELRRILSQEWHRLFQTYCNEKGVNIMTTHLFFIQDDHDTETKEPEDENSINIGGTSAIYVTDIPQGIQYTALGHLHRCQKIGSEEVWYSGSPLGYSFAESNQDKYVLISEIEPHQKAITKKIKLNSGKTLMNLHATQLSDAIEQLHKYQNSWIDLTMETEHYLTASELKSIYNSHSGIVTLRPYLKNDSFEKIQTQSIQKLIHDKDALFSHFFESQKGQTPNMEIMNLFHEIIAQP